MSDSSPRSWTDFLRPITTELLSRIPWSAFLLLNLSLRYPWISRSQIFDLACQLGASPQHVRAGIHSLTKKHDVLVEIPDQYRTPSIASLPSPFRLSAGNYEVLVQYGVRTSPILARRLPAGWTVNKSEPVYCLAEEAPSSELIRQIRLLGGSERVEPNAGGVTYAKSPLIVNWLGLTQVYLRYLAHDSPAASGFVAVSSRLAAYRPQCVLSLPTNMQTPEALDEATSQLMAESHQVTSDVATAVTFYSAFAGNQHAPDFYKQDIPEAKKWRDFEIWLHQLGNTTLTPWDGNRLPGKL